MKRGNNRERREKEKAERRERKRIAMQAPGAMSTYARKRKYLNRHGTRTSPGGAVVKRVPGQCSCPECSAAAGARLRGERLIRTIVWRRGRWIVVVITKRIKRGDR